jgi:hypothetical protein
MWAGGGGLGRVRLGGVHRQAGQARHGASLRPQPRRLQQATGQHARPPGSPPCGKPPCTASYRRAGGAWLTEELCAGAADNRPSATSVCLLPAPNRRSTLPPDPLQTSCLSRPAAAAGAPLAQGLAPLALAASLIVATPCNAVGLESVELPGLPSSATSYESVSTCMHAGGAQAPPKASAQQPAHGCLGPIAPLPMACVCPCVSQSTAKAQKQKLADADSVRSGWHGMPEAQRSLADLAQPCLWLLLHSRTRAAKCPSIAPLRSGFRAKWHAQGAACAQRSQQGAEQEGYSEQVLLPVGRRSRPARQETPGLCWAAG